MSLQPYSNDELNFFKFASIVVNEFPKALRQIFVGMWDKRIAPLSGYQPWDDTPAVRNMLLNSEGGKTKIPTNSSFQKWDCTTLFQATLYARTFALPDSKGNTKTLGELYLMNRNPIPGPFHLPVASGDPNETNAFAIDQLRLLRNTLCHSCSPRFNKVTFDNYVQHAKEAFTAVNLSTTTLETIGNLSESDFPTTKITELNERIVKERGDSYKFLTDEVKNTMEEVKRNVDEMKISMDELLRQKTEDETKKQNRFCVLPLMPSHEITNRETTVRKFYNKMKELRENNPDSVTSFYISGNPGCGKTQFARLLGEAMYAETCFSFVFTLDASSSDSLYASMFNLAQRLGLSPENIAKEIPEKDTFHTKFQKLCSLVGVKTNSRQGWLLIIDGVGVRGLEQEMQFWRNPGIQNWGAGQVVITTQREDDIPEGKKVLHERFQQGLEVDEAIELLKNISITDQSDDNDIQTLKQVAKELDYQPLALVNAAMYTRQISKINRNFKWVNYLEKLLAGKQEAMEDGVAKKNECYPVGMVLATRLVVEQLIKSSKIVKYIFLALGFCSHAPVPVDLLLSFVKSIIGNDDEENVLLVMKECCLFLWQQQSAVNTLTVHQVIYQRFLALKTNAKETLFRKWLDTIENFTKELSRDKVPRTFAVLSFLKPHLPIINTTTKQDSQLFSPPVKNPLCHAEYEGPGLLRKLNAFRDVYKMVHDVRNMLKYELAVFQIQNNCHGISDSERVNTRHRLGIVYRKFGYLEQAEEHFLNSLEMAKSFHGESAPGIAVTLHELGRVYFSRGDLQKAEEYFLKSLEMQILFHGESAPGIAVTLNELGRIYLSRGDLQKAEEHFLKSLEMEKSFYGGSAPGIAVALCDLGRVYLSRGDPQKAEEHYLKSLEMKKSFHGESAPGIAVTLHELGSVYLSCGDLQKAEEHFLKSLEMKKLFHGDSAPGIAVTLHELGSVHLSRGDLQKAEEQFLMSLEMEKSFNGESAPGIAVTLHELGRVYLSRGDTQKADEHFLKSLEMKKLFQGESEIDKKVFYV